MNKKIKSVSMVLAVLLIFAFAGCTKVIIEKEEPTEPTTPSTPATETPAAPSTPAPAPSTTPAPAASSEAEKIVNTIVEDAMQGKVINCSIAAQSSMEDVKTEWGDPDSDSYVSTAKGSYAEYTEKGVVFGYNQAMEIFEVRRVAGDVLEEITFKDIKAVLGDPPYSSVDVNFNPIYGYQISDVYKLVFVMDETGNESGVEHYNVLWPEGSADLMTGDMGKDW